ncbi:hypothetical protein F4679DRAFT_597051 [Xylaria curta]|nr:hypothetical protein F4679DRAFT_597051 [Xylaria curta]
MTLMDALRTNCDKADPTLCRWNTTPWRDYCISEIADSAASGCLFCSYLAHSLDDAGFQIYTNKRDNTWNDRWLHFRVLRAAGDSDSQPGLGDTGLNITYLQVFGQDPKTFGPPGAMPLLEFHVVADLGDLASISRDVVGRYTTRNTSSQDLIDTIKSWVASYVEKHSECSLALSEQKIPTPTPLPSRRIPWQLVGYVFVCQRWPTLPKELQGATTSANLADRLAGQVALESKLPPHFVDACMLTLRLGFKEQEDLLATTDWAYEATRKASYYQNSRLTIAGTYGDDTIGLFRAETPENSRPLIRLPYSARPGSIVPRPSFFYLIPSDCYINQDYEDFEWVFSRRILYYTPTNYVEGEAGGNQVFLKSLKRLNIRHDGADICRICPTRPETDKLMGLVGIASEFGRALVHKLGLTEAKSPIWVGGLWLADIFQSPLGEEVGHLPAPAPRPSLDWYDAGGINEVPSWSWASRRCAVRRPGMVTAATPETAKRTGEDWELLPIIGDDVDPDHARLVDPTKTFTVLCVRARLVSVLIREDFADDEERQVVIPSFAGHICGWVSLGSDQNQGQTDPGCEVRTNLAAADNEEAAGAAPSEKDQKLLTSLLTTAGQQRVVPGQEHAINDENMEEQERNRQQQTATEGEDLGRRVHMILVLAATYSSGAFHLGYLSLHYAVYAFVFVRTKSTRRIVVIVV